VRAGERTAERVASAASFALGSRGEAPDENNAPNICSCVQIMPFKFFTVPIQDAGQGEAELNAFLRGRKILAVDRRWVEPRAGVVLVLLRRLPGWRLGRGGAGTRAGGAREGGLQGDP